MRVLFDACRGRLSQVHLESLSNAKARRLQLTECVARLAPNANAVLCGDFNFDDVQEWGAWRQNGKACFGSEASGEASSEASGEASPFAASLAAVASGASSKAAAAVKTAPLENAVLSEVACAFADAWLQLRPGERGATFDGQTNPACVHDRQEVMRYDRVMLKADGAGSAGSSWLRWALGAPRSPWVAQRIDMLGTEDVTGEGLPQGLKPSDHYGLEFDCAPSQPPPSQPPPSQPLPSQP